MWVVVWLIARLSYTPTTQDTLSRTLYLLIKVMVSWYPLIV
jgi:hypothetical protein